MTESKITEPKITPMMAHYFEIKKQYPDCLVFYRLGDFYELFYDDAKKASAELGIVLTNRGKNENSIPMCGVPFHAYEHYLTMLVKAGYKVVICEQMETPAEAKKRGAGAVVKRDVIRVVTAGTLIEDALLDAKKNNFLMLIVANKLHFALAWSDISTGVLQTQVCTSEDIMSVISCVDPVEIVLEEGFHDQHSGILHLFDQRYTYQDTRIFNPVFNKEDAFNYFPQLDASLFDELEIRAIGALIKYVKQRQCQDYPSFQMPQHVSANTYMSIDASTRKSLELTSSLSDNKTSVLKAIDYTKTAMGTRLLTQYLSTPLTDISQINERLDKVSFFVKNPVLREKVRELLKTIPDLERILSRIMLGSSGPSEVLSFAYGLEKIPQIEALLLSENLPQSLDTDRLLFGCGYRDVYESIFEVITPEQTPALARNGGFVCKGFNPQLDEIRDLKDNAKKFVLDLQQKYITLTGINALKISYNNLIGYYVDVPARYAQDILNREDKLFILRQSLVNASRFTTLELSELETKIIHADDEAKAMEMDIYNNLLEEIRSLCQELKLTFLALSRIDVASSLAHNADLNQWCRPILTDDYAFEIKGGRHPVVERSLQQEKISFVPNDCVMEQDKLWILTGPNMAGKSTFLRQNAVIAILAQCGSFVPAESAKIGIVDKVFSRVGASDDLARGRSTFMVEMVEVATILNGATPKSLVILDEVGRGTATFDGLSIAWAVLEYLHDMNKCRGLFATHYHELTALANRMDHISLHTMRVKEWQGDIVFMHEVCQGAIDRSYGIHVGKLAGLPKSVLHRAGQILEQLEEKKQSQQPLFDDLPLFQQAIKEQEQKSDSLVEKTLRSLNVDDLSPREALEYLYELKKMMED